MESARVTVEHRRERGPVTIIDASIAAASDDVIAGSSPARSGPFANRGDPTANNSKEASTRPA
jgi:hypothetical protein